MLGIGSPGFSGLGPRPAPYFTRPPGNLISVPRDSTELVSVLGSLSILFRGWLAMKLTKVSDPGKVATPSSVRREETGFFKVRELRGFLSANAEDVFAIRGISRKMRII